MNVSFTSIDVLNTSVLDDATQRPLFEVATPRFKLGHRNTTIKNANGEVVAEYQPHLGHDTVTLNGRTSRKSEWLPKKNVLSSDRLLTAPDGQVYIWKEKWSGSFKASLVPADSPKDADPVVETHHTNVLSRSRRGGMTVHPDLMPYLDAILLSFVICERESQERAASAAAAGG